MNKYKNIFITIGMLAWFVVIYFIIKNILIIYFALAILMLSIISDVFFKKSIYLWTKFGSLLGYINSKIILFILFYLIITPYSFFLRVFNKKISILAKNDLTSFVNKEYTYKQDDFKNMW